MTLKRAEFEPDEFHETAHWAGLGKLFFAAILIAGAVMMFGSGRPGSARGDDGWLTDWEQAVAESKSTGKPALVLFTADWCPACRQFDSETLKDSDVRAYLAANQTLVVVDLTDRDGPNADRARDFGVDSIPTLVLYAKSGQEVARSHGMGPTDFVNWLESYR